MEDISLSLRQAPPSLPLLTNEARANFLNNDLLPNEEADMFRNRIGTAYTLPLESGSDSEYSDEMGQAPASAYQAQAQGASSAYQPPKSLTLKEVQELRKLREKQRMFTDLESELALKRMQLDNGTITQEDFDKQAKIFQEQIASLNLTEAEEIDAGLLLLNQKRGGKRKSHYSKTNKMRRSRSNKRSKSRSKSNKRSRSRSNKRYRSRK